MKCRHKCNLILFPLPSPPASLCVPPWTPVQPSHLLHLCPWPSPRLCFCQHHRPSYCGWHWLCGDRSRHRGRHTTPPTPVLPEGLAVPFHPSGEKSLHLQQKRRLKRHFVGLLWHISYKQHLLSFPFGCHFVSKLFLFKVFAALIAIRVALCYIMDQSNPKLPVILQNSASPSVYRGNVCRSSHVCNMIKNLEI